MDHNGQQRQQVDSKREQRIGCSSGLEKGLTLRMLLAPALLLLLLLEVRPRECKSMPLDQQQILPSVVPMIMLSKPNQQHAQHLSLNHQQHAQIQPQNQHQQQQQTVQNYQQQQQQVATEANRGDPSHLLASPALLMMNLTEPPVLGRSMATYTVASPSLQLASASASNSAGQDIFQTAASYLNEVSSKQVAGRRQPAQLPEPASASAAGDADEGDSEADEQERDDEAPAGLSAAALPAPPQHADQEREREREQEQALAEPIRRQAASGRVASVEAITRLRYHGPALNMEQAEAQADGNNEAAARREQETAEASEAEVADRSALDEQRQAQREIILAQAQSEAKAIKEQQEALLKQQALQQQMILRRQDLDRNRSSSALGQAGSGQRPTGARHSTTKKWNNQQQQQLRQQLYDDEADESPSERRDRPHQHLTPNNHHQRHPMQHKSLAAKSQHQDEDTDYSIRRPAVIRRDSTAALLEGSIPRFGVGDLLPAAQHSYGVHFAPLHGYQKDYYQFAESFKKGQFHSGYKRGGKKLQISGHASQHKNHAEGHAKWNGYKGKGVSYWNYQHGDKKKHYGDGGDYGHGHGYGGADGGHSHDDHSHHGLYGHY